MALKFDGLKRKFYNDASKILIYRGDKKRSLPKDEREINKYKNDLIQSYNELASDVQTNFENFDQSTKDKRVSSFDQHYKPRLIEALTFLGFSVDSPANFEIIDKDKVVQMPESGAFGGQDDSKNDNVEQHEEEEDDDVIFDEMMNKLRQSNYGLSVTNPNGKNLGPQNPPGGLKSGAKTRTFVNSRFSGLRPDDFDNMYSLDPSRIAANRGRSSNWRNPNPHQNTNTRFGSNSYPNANFNSNSRAGTNVNFNPNSRENANLNPNLDEDVSQVYDDDVDDFITEINFYNLCARTFTETYAGDPLALKPFINKINMVQRMCQHEGHEAILKDFIMSHVKGIASDILPAEPESIESIKSTLRAKIKPENSKVVKGKLMALKADRNNLTEYTKKAEQLAESLKRSLILENFPYENANKMVIEDTIDLCRANTNSVLVKAGLIGYQFKDAKEVLAKFIIESRRDVEEKQILSFRQTNSNSNRNFGGNFGNNFQRRGNNYGRNYYQNQNQNRNYQNNNYNRGNYQSRGNSRGNARGRGSNYRGRGNNYYQNRRPNRTYYYAENDRAPPSGAAQAQNVQVNQADRQ